MVQSLPSGARSVATEGIAPHLERLRVNLAWVLRLRWLAAVGQGVTVAVAAVGLGVELPVVPIALVIAVELATNAALVAWFRKAGDERWAERVGVAADLLTAVLFADVLLLLLLLHWTGGGANPFGLFVVIHSLLGALVLSPRRAWALAGVLVAGYLAVMRWHWPLDRVDLGAGAFDGGWLGADGAGLFLRGALVAVPAAALFVVHAVTRVTSSLAHLEREFEAARHRRHRAERLEGLATLAAGAAHELASPLSTIAVVAKELERELRTVGLAEGEAAEDARLIRDEVARCQGILEAMAADAGQDRADRVESVALRDLVALALEPLERAPEVRLEWVGGAEGWTYDLPRRAVALALRQLVKNALDASPAGVEVALRVEGTGAELVLTVVDQGSGMSAEVLARAEEPFFTTKEPGRGMGLGLFLARTVVERYGGRLTLESAPGRGTRARVEVPVA